MKIWSAKVHFCTPKEKIYRIYFQGETMTPHQETINLGEAFADITDPDTYVRGVPHATFKRLRDEDPVSWWDEKEGSGFWAITRYDDLLYVSHNPRLFS